jgi:hypothetical protein
MNSQLPDLAGYCTKERIAVGQAWKIFVFDRNICKPADLDNTDGGGYFPSKLFYQVEFTDGTITASEPQHLKNLFQTALLGGLSIKDALKYANFKEPHLAKCYEIEAGTSFVWEVYQLKHDTDLAILYKEAERELGFVRAFNSNHANRQDFYKPDFTAIQRMKLCTNLAPPR